jgi:DNA polymerase
MLLTDIITKGMGLRRDDVYIANVVKCRPPRNRNPEPDEIVACEPFLHRQISLIRPRVIVTLGKFATQVLLRSRTPISQVRGKWHDYQGVPLMPTFHPAYLLRNPSDKRVVWEDIKQVMTRLELPLPRRAG